MGPANIEWAHLQRIQSMEMTTARKLTGPPLLAGSGVSLRTCSAVVSSNKNPPVSLSYILHDTNNLEQSTAQWYRDIHLRSS